MTSYYDGKRASLARTRLAGDLTLGSRQAVVQFLHQPLISIRRYCVPMACDVNTRADLYDLAAAVRQFKAMNNATMCVIPDGHGTRCGSSVMTHAPYPVCAVHAATISEFFLKQDKLELARAAAFARQNDAPSYRLPAGEPRSSVVYYVQLDAVIKIGTSIDVKERMKTYPPYARLLVTEPGGFTLEAKRHRQFNEYLRAGKEWFDIGPRLREHIEKLMAAADGEAA